MVIAVVLSMILGLSMQVSMAIAGESAEAAQIDREVDASLKKFLEDTPEAEIFRKDAKGILVMDKGMGKSLTTTMGRSDVYAFIFDQQGLMAGLVLQGSKITRIHP